MRYVARGIAILAFLIFGQIVQAGEKGQPRFYLDYAVVQHSLMGDKGLHHEFMDLAKLDRQGADFIAEFWLEKAARECRTILREGSQEMVKKYISEKEFTQQVEMCFYGVYYEKWEAINLTISNRLAVAKKKASMPENP